MWKKIVDKLIVSNKEKPVTSSKEKKRKPDVVVVTERSILVVTEALIANELGVLQIESGISSVSSDIVEEFKDCFTGVGIKAKRIPAEVACKRGCGTRNSATAQTTIHLRGKLRTN